MMINHFDSTKKLTPPPFIYIYILLLTSFIFFKVSLQHFLNLTKQSLSFIHKLLGVRARKFQTFSDEIIICQIL